MGPQAPLFLQGEGYCLEVPESDPDELLVGKQGRVGIPGKDSMSFVPAAVLGVATPVLTRPSQTSCLRPETAHLSRPTAPQAKLTSAKHTSPAAFWDLTLVKLLRIQNGIWPPGLLK